MTHPIPARAAWLWLAAAALPAAAQTAPQLPAPAPAPAAPAPAGEVQRVEITGGRQSDNEQRRQSTAAKIIIGREEIERFGDASLGDLMKRLPGVTLQGRPGRGGEIRMRGLGGGYTQILLDGERVQGGLSLDQMDPDQIERIEILRAPTAETGARAIAGTINIITREGFVKRLNDLKLELGVEQSLLQPRVTWARTGQIDAFDYNLTVALNHSRRRDESTVTTVSRTLDQTEVFSSDEKRLGVNLNARLRWRLGEGNTLMLMPLLIRSKGDTERGSVVDRRLGSGIGNDYDTSTGTGEGLFSLARLNGNWNYRLEDGTRMEWRGGLGDARFNNRNLNTQVGTTEAGTLQDTDFDDTGRSRERTASLNVKFSKTLENDHSLVSGLEADLGRRTEYRLNLIDGKNPLQGVYGNTLRASTQRVAAYAQDEWTVSPQWAAHAGLRWEGITTQGEGEDSTTPRNRTSVWTPLAHAVWKPDPKSRDQVRISLTRSYRSPSLQNLLGRPSINRFALPDGTNTATRADSAGNPALKPELATGIDLAFERYLPGGGMLSASVFRRNIQDLIRTITTLETVPWSPVPRYVARPQNIGDATTQGLELEAKLRLNEMVDDAPAVDLRANASFYRSRVATVPGPDNRLDQQPGATANLGADYRLPGLPVTLGANFNWTPGYTTRLAENQWLVQNAKRVFDAYAQWAINPNARLRLSASNLAPQDAVNISTLIEQDGPETATTVARTYVNWRLQLELKL